VLKHKTKSKRINTKDHFELRYLRWDHLVRAENPKDEGIFEENRKTVEVYANRYYMKYEELLRLNSLDADDLKNIIRCFIVSYNGLWSFSANPEKLEKFKAQFVKQEGVEPSPSIIYKKNNSNMMSYIEQKLDDMVNVFRIKNKEQAGYFSDEFYKIGTRASREQLDLPSFGSTPSKNGWQKLSKKEYFELKPILMQIGRGQSKRINNHFYKSFVTGGQMISYETEDGPTIIDSFADKSPDALTQLVDSERDFDLSFLDNFANKSPDEKVGILNVVIDYVKDGDFNTSTLAQVEALRSKYELQKA
jgi:hypothetical protein